MFRNSVWSRDGGDMSLHSFNESEGPSTNPSGENARRVQNLVSKFSVSDDDDDEHLGDYSPYQASSPFSSLVRPAQRTPLEIPSVFTVGQRPHEREVPQIIGNGAQQEKPSRQLQSRAGIRGNTATLEEPKMTLLWEILFVAVICVAHLCVQINSMSEAGIGQTLPITKGVGSRFKVANANNLSVAIAGYAVALGTFILIAGRLGETFGERRIFIVGLLWSAAGSLVVGVSFYSSQLLFIASRAFQGVGAALTLPTGLELLRARRATGVRRAVIFTLYAAMSPVGLIVGALGASGFVALTWWPWVYWAFSITLTVLGIISCFVIPSTHRARGLPSGARAAALELDIPGIITGIASFGLFGFAWCAGSGLAGSIPLDHPDHEYSAWGVVRDARGMLRPETSDSVLGAVVGSILDPRRNRLWLVVFRCLALLWLAVCRASPIHSPLVDCGEFCAHRDFACALLHRHGSYDGWECPDLNDANPADLLAAAVYKCAYYVMGRMHERPHGRIDDFEGGT
ncbi:hypothetical protein O1611_g2418 [Lasiodiplodia mahajangana]|uniref:Uncharacterized protein n=1 Tax=Lasiodiplodia mahajangana TaxID=1108764 RepID=A0ACC2JVB6_9PEZI|nr:hypothetical protein O1611_g2418 [Lasiodiplodia mahajangana]